MRTGMVLRMPPTTLPQLIPPPHHGKKIDPFRLGGVKIPSFRALSSATLQLISEPTEVPHASSMPISRSTSHHQHKIKNNRVPAPGMHRHSLNSQPLSLPMKEHWSNSVS